MSIQVNNLPDKSYFKIGEVGQITGIEPHVLRYWEKRFPWLRPEKSLSKQRLFTRDNLLLVLLIQHLLYEKRFTIEGAISFLEALKGDWKLGITQVELMESAHNATDDVSVTVAALKKEVGRLRDELRRKESELEEFREKYRRMSLEVHQYRKVWPEFGKLAFKELVALRLLARTSH